MRAAAALAMALAASASVEALATQTMEQTKAAEAPTLPADKASEGVSDRLRILLQEQSESPFSDDLWKQFVEHAKVEYDDRAWGWLQENVDAPSTAAALREAHPDFPAYHLEWVQIAMEMDAGFISAPRPGGATADDVALSAMRQLLRSTSAEGLTLVGRLFVPEYAVLPGDVHDLDDEDKAMAWKPFADTIRPREELKSFPGYNAIQNWKPSTPLRTTSW